MVDYGAKWYYLLPSGWVSSRLTVRPMLTVFLVSLVIRVETGTLTLFCVVRFVMVCVAVVFLIATVGLKGVFRFRVMLKWKPCDRVDAVARTRLFRLDSFVSALGLVFCVVVKCVTLVKLWAMTVVCVSLFRFVLTVVFVVTVTMPPSVLFSLVLAMLAAWQSCSVGAVSVRRSFRFVVVLV